MSLDNWLIDARTTSTMPPWQHLVHNRKPSWHDRIAAVLSRTGQPRVELNSFPGPELNSIIQEHLRENNRTPGTRSSETYLLENIREHEFPDPALRFGTVLASLPCVSGPVGRDLLRSCISPDVLVGDPHHGGTNRYQRGPLRAGPLKLSATAICLARRTNPAVVTDVEDNCAMHILRYSGDSAMSHGQWIRTFLRLWVSLPMHHLLVHPNVEAVFEDACARYSNQLEQFEAGYQYHEARMASKWLVPFLTDPITNKQVDLQELSLVTVRSSNASSSSTGLIDQIHEMLGDLGSPTTDPRLVRAELPVEYVIGSASASRQDQRPSDQTQHPTALLPGHMQPASAVPGTRQGSATSRVSNEQPRRSSDQPRRSSNQQRRSTDRSRDGSISPISAGSPGSPGSPASPGSPGSHSASLGASVRVYAQILNKYMPAWRTWANWRPDAKRIERWSKLRDSDRMALKDMLALEGRDRTIAGSSTHFQCLFNQIKGTNRRVKQGDLHLDVPDADVFELLQRLYNALDAAQALGQKGVDIYISLSSSDHADIVLDLFQSIPRDKFCDRALEGLASVLKGTNTVANMDSLVALLDASKDNYELCEMLRPVLLRSTHATFVTARETFVSQVERDRVADELGMTLHRFAVVLHSNHALGEHFEADLYTILRCLPSEETLKRVFEYRSSVQHRRSYQLRNDPSSGWLLNKFRGGGSQADIPDRLVEALCSVWKRRLSADCQNIALTLLHMEHVDVDIIEACLQELPTTPTWFASKWLPVLNTSADFPFVQMAEVLVLTGDEIDRKPYRPWLKYWAWKFDDLIPESLIPLAKRIPLPKWFKWTRNVITLLSTDLLSNANGLQRTASWSTQLLTTYKSPLARLSTMLGGEDANLAWLLVQESQSAVDILDALEFDPGGDHWVIMAKLVKALEADGGNATSIAGRLQQVKIASDRSLAAAVALVEGPAPVPPITDTASVASVNTWNSEPHAEEAPPGYDDHHDWTQDEQAFLKVVQAIAPPAVESVVPMEPVEPGIHELDLDHSSM